MSNFIEIVGKEDKKRRFINVNHIEVVTEVNENRCNIYLAFNSPHALEQDYYELDKPYDEVISMIVKGGV